MKSKKEIFSDILVSTETGCVLKIKLKGARNPIITAVERVGKKEIVLKPTCLYGYKLKQRNIRLPDIEDVVRYKTNFHSPLFEKLRFIKNNIAGMRRDFQAVGSEHRTIAGSNA